MSERIFIFRTALAVALKSERKATILEFVRHCCESKKDNRFPHCYYEGEWYMWDTYDAWQRRMPWVSLSTIRKTFSEMRKDGWLKTAHLSPNKTDRTLYYTVNKAKVQRAYAQFEHMEEEDLKDTKSDPNLAHGSAEVSAHGSVTYVTDASAEVSAHLPITYNHTKNHTKSPDEFHKKCSPFDIGMAEKWIEFAKAHSKNGRFKLPQFAEAIMRMRTKFELTEEQIGFMLNWIRQDEFWCTNALSPVSLLKKSKSCPEITKLEQVINRIKSRKKTEKEKLYESAMKFDASLKAKEKEPDMELSPEIALLTEQIRKENTRGW